MSVLGINFLNEIVSEKLITKPSDALDALRFSIKNILNQDEDLKTLDGIDIALMSINKEKKLLEASLANSSIYLFRNPGNKALDINGKNILPVMVNDHGALYEIKPDKYPVGSFIGEDKPFTNLKITLCENDLIFAGTDGYSDQFGGPNKKKLKYSRLEAILFQMGNLETCAAQKDFLESHFEEWKSTEEQVDDVLGFGVKI